MRKIILISIFMLPSLSNAAVEAKFTFSGGSYEFITGPASSPTLDIYWRDASETLSAQANTVTSVFQTPSSPYVDFRPNASATDAGSYAYIIADPAYELRNFSGKVIADDGNAAINGFHTGAITGFPSTPNTVRFSGVANLTAEIDNPLYDSYSLNITLSFFQYETNGLITYEFDTVNFVNGVDQLISVDYTLPAPGVSTEVRYLLYWSLAATSMAPVPEPSNYALLGLGLGVIGLRRKFFK